MKTKFLLYCALLYSVVSFSQAIEFAKSLEVNPLRAMATRAISMEVDSNGNIIVLGGFNGSIDIDPSLNQYLLHTDVGTPEGKTNMFLAKYSPQGDLLWGFEIGNTGGISGSSLAIDQNDNIIVVGILSALHVDFDPGVNEYLWGGSSDLFVVKYSSSGAFEWFNKIETVVSTSQIDNIKIINFKNGDKNYFVIGATIAGTIGIIINNTNTYLNTERGDIMIADLNSNGNWTSVSKYGGHYNDDFTNLYQDNNSKLIFSWYKNGGVSNNGDRITYLVRRETNGSTSNILRLSGNVFLVGLKQNISNEFYLFGDFSDGITDVDTGTLILPNIHHIHEGFLIKLDSNETYEWIKHIEADGSGMYPSSLRAMDMEIIDNTVIIAASFRGKFDILNQNGLNRFVENINSVALNSLFVKYYQDGNVAWDFIYNGQSPNSIASLKSFNNKIYTYGLFTNLTDFNPHSVATTTMNSTNNSSDFYIAKYDNIFIFNPLLEKNGFGEIEDYTANIGTLGVDDFSVRNGNLIITTEGNKQYEVSLTTAYEGATYLAVYNILGQQLKVKMINKLGDSYKARLDMSEAASGVYIVKVGGTNTKSFKTGRIIVE